MIVIGVVRRRTYQIINIIDKAPIYIRAILIHGKSCLLLISWSKDGIILQNYLILGMGHIEITPESQAISKHLIKFQFQLITTGTNLTFINSRRCRSEIRRNRTVGAENQDVITTITEEIQRTSNQASQETIIDTEVGFLNCFPSHILISKSVLSIPCIDTLCMVEIHSTLAAISPLTHIQPATRRIKWVTNVVITNLTIGSTELQHIDDVLVTKILHEVFLSDGPSDSTRIEEGKTIVLAELF